RLARIAELAVVVVLDDPGVVARCPVEEGYAPLETERGAGRILMRRRDVGESRARRAADADVDAHSLAIDRHGRDRRAGEIERSARAEVARVFDPDGVAAIEQQHGERVQRLLRAVEDDDVIRLAADAAELREMSRDRRTKCRQAARIGEIQSGVTELARGAR